MVLTTERRSDPEIKFYSRKKHSLPGSVCRLDNPLSHDDPTIAGGGNEVILSEKCRPGVTALWSGKHVAVWVPWERRMGSPADFPCEQKQKSTKRTRKLDSWPTKRKREHETRV